MLAQSSEIYLDSNATTRVLPQAAQAAQEAMGVSFGNPSSTHISGLRARYILESTRKLARKVIGASSGEIIFLSGATEGLQTAIFSSLLYAKNNPSKVESPLLLYGASEHKAVAASLEHWNTMLQLDAEVCAIPVNRNGVIDFDFMAEHAPRALMISTMAVNNETGVILDLKKTEQVIRNNTDAPWMVDCVQALGKIPLQVSKTSIDYAPFSGHKLHAPKGIGLLYVREGAPLFPIIAGGGQEQGYRSGTENLPGVAAFGAIFELLSNPHQNVFKDHDTLLKYRSILVKALEKAFPNIVFNTPFEISVPSTINFSVPGLSSKELINLFDAASVRVSSGSACSSKVSRSIVLDAMGLEQWRSESAIRISFSPTNSLEEIEVAAEQIENSAQALRKSCLSISSDDLDPEGEKISGLKQFKHGDTCTWVYVVPQEKSCFIIDPVPALAERLEMLVQCQRLKVLAVLSTHTHPGEEDCASLLRELLWEAIPKNYREVDALGWPKQATQALNLPNSGTALGSLKLSEKNTLIQVPLPGHTNDSTGYLLSKPSKEEKLLNCFFFSGDTLLIGGLGRSDLPESQGSDLFRSLKRLTQLLGPKTLICPAHDYNNEFTSTLEAELKQGDLLRSIFQADSQLSEDEFLDKKNAVEETICDSKIQGACEQYNSNEALAIEVLPGKLQEFFQKQENVIFADVRDAYEHALFGNLESYGLRSKPQNVPLSSFCNFISELLEENNYEQNLIFLCRSGNRSDIAAKNLRRLGFKKATNIAGGLALCTPDKGK